MMQRWRRRRTDHGVTLTTDDDFDWGVGPGEDEPVYDERFLQMYLETRVKHARRHLRPLSVVVFRVAAMTGVELAEIIAEIVREADVLAQMDAGPVTLVMEETGEDGLRVVVERLHRILTDRPLPLEMHAGGACYPAHALTASELLAGAWQALIQASMKGETLLLPPNAV
jgi:GGDEF domain-containing protein